LGISTNFMSRELVTEGSSSLSLSAADAVVENHVPNAATHAIESIDFTRRRFRWLRIVVPFPDVAIDSQA
jgi:hypothetical protein